MRHRRCPPTVRRELEHEQDPRCRVLQEDYLKLIRQLGSREAITRRFFLVFEYEPLPGTKRGHEEEDAIASLQTAARTAANYLRQCGNEVISPENEDDATAEILYNILCRRASSEPFYQRVKSVLADYMASGRDINTIPVNEFYAPDRIDLSHGSYLCIDGLYYGGDACINQGYADGWLNLTAMAAPDSRLCRYAIYESGFAAFDIALYSSQLYPEGETLSSQDNAFHAAVSFGLCEDTCAGTDIITRGEAADLLYALLTGEFTVAPPPILETIPLNNKEGVHLNSYLLELQKIPEPIRQAFAERGWQYTIDYEYLARLSEERNMSCIGATNYGNRQITVSSAGATIHEFGHFLDELIGFPSQTEGFYQEESGTAAALLRPYALTNEREYFADCFVYWLTYRDNSKKMAALQSAAPRTYAYFFMREENDWQITAS